MIHCHDMKHVYCSLSDPHTSPSSSIATGSASHDKEFNNYAHAAGSHVHAAATGGQAVKNRLAASFNLKEEPLLGNQCGSSKHKVRSSGSSKPHSEHAGSSLVVNISNNFFFSCRWPLQSTAKCCSLYYRT